MADSIEGLLSSPGTGAAAGLPAQPGRSVSTATPEPGTGSAPAFSELLQAQAGSELRFSTHAQERLRARQIQLSAEDQADLAHAVQIAGEKGAQESLILIDDLALIVSVRNKVVITAMERGNNQANVFTHIDSAVVLPRHQVDGLA